MDTQEQPWARWSGLQVGDAGAQIAFWETLAKRQGWTIAFAENVFLEYRKFLFLVLTTPTAVTPPAPVKAAWDLHRELPSWRALPEAPEIERRIQACEPLNPTALEQTRILYALTFGTYPPESIWPARTGRSGPKLTRKRRALVQVLLGLVGISLAIWLPEPWGILAGLAAALLIWLIPNWSRRTEAGDLNRLSHAIRGAGEGNGSI